VIWCQYYLHGKRVRESTKETDKRKATTYLNKRLQEVAAGIRNPEADKITVRELVEAKLTSARNNGKKSVSDDEARWRLHLSPFFGNMKAGQVSTVLLNKYVAQRKTEEIVKTYTLKSGGSRNHATGKFPDNGTINRELALLRSAFYLAYESTPPRVARVPKFPMLEEHNVRTGFLNDTQYYALAQECGKVGLWLRTLFEVGATYGWRRSEVVTNLLVKQVDFDANVIRLEPDTTKNDDGREVTIIASLRPLLKACCEGKASDKYVITREDGKPVKDFRASWWKACDAAGVPDLLFHDLRRTGARNLRRAGVHEGVIMKIGGWKTRSVFERYAIVAQEDIRDAMAKLERQRSDFSHSLAKEAQEAVQQKNQGRVVN
jgi:integrase